MLVLAVSYFMEAMDTWLASMGKFWLGSATLFRCWLIVIYTSHSLAVDQLLAAQVVLADGSIVWASDEENQDLFFGIRGAGNRLGVITKVDHLIVHILSIS